MPSRHERSLLAKEQTIFRNLASKSVIFRRTSFFYMPQICDMGQMFYFPSEGRHAQDFSNRKNPTASVGSEPAILGTRGQHANP
jgi:hypothetical protein